MQNSPNLKNVDAQTFFSVIYRTEHVNRIKTLILVADFNEHQKTVSLCCSHIIFGELLAETFAVFKNFPYISTAEWITRGLYYLWFVVSIQTVDS